jgi:predicted metal-dependent HD superfamily phosphohydrolase
MYDLDRLTNQWQQCCQSLSVDRSESDRLFQLLVNAYTQPDRYYHNLEHIDRVLATIDRFSDSIDQPLTVSLAVWFHDFVYDPQALDNELQSAKIARNLLKNCGGSLDLIDRVSQLILATQGHQIVSEDRDLSIFLDADLEILGAEPNIYQAYHQNIRREYSWVSDVDYRVGRMRVLDSFLQRDRIYHTELLFNELESISRTNIDREIQFLTSTI